ncbi:hypothetical protein QV06_03115 [Gallibacterium genomosp. 3]|uniref:BrnT family toxin n=1 Tax=Gallibacterium genomosp. 3 TaxID=505345 RepID=A0A1A7PU11_9PAST|nr:BrnT family toxin [Gallibacterium genomosp. 3]OBX05211.1 hypothetical protein QV06_03115 [Gallibacterium genomosp. 3]
MKISYDPNKNNRNLLLRNLSFDLVSDFDWKNALVWQDTRFFYPEPRFIALGKIEQRVYVICFTPIEDGIRVISFRKANKREVRRYVQK